MTDVPDRIEKQIHLRAPPSRVWHAITDSKAFGTWFGVDFEGPFVTGGTVRGRIVPTKVDPEVAKLQEQHSGVPFEVYVERIEPESLFSFRWHPYAVDMTKDYAHEPTTLVTFTLEPSAGGTLLRLSESGYSKIPLERRAEAFTSNDGGWTAQMTLIGKYVQGHA